MRILKPTKAMSKHLTGICANCGKKKEEHFSVTKACPQITNMIIERAAYCFKDEGQSRLEANAEELLGDVNRFLYMEKFGQPHDRIDAIRKLEKTYQKCYGKG